MVTIDEIKKQLSTQFCNGYYIKRPMFRLSETIYITKNNSIFFVRDARNLPNDPYYGTSVVIETTFTSTEEDANDWIIVDKQ